MAADDLMNDLRKIMQLQTISKALLAAAAGSLFAVGTSPAFAQDTADLAVKGTIVPAACSANFTGGDTVDFGTIKVVDLLPNSYNKLGSKNTELNVTCSSDKRVSFSMSDAQSASRITDSAMVSLLQATHSGVLLGLGTATVNGSPVNLGAYYVLLDQTTVDGAARTAIYSNNSGASWNGRGSGTEWLVPNSTTLFSAGSNTTTQIAGNVFNFPLEVVAGLNTGSALQVASDTPLNGQAVFTINYQ
ncbi:DUF1120 domain-containing protein [Ralstonia sp. SET104]|uniref:DUF1120 domain-containing protein n=1 Tax=Ralstonia sp. SET104 TaxID=2448774 RepID=UPI000F5660B3|nr:DUF1120 domain-containing protein [Ralstonia sp. SET104]